MPLSKTGFVHAILLGKFIQTLVLTEQTAKSARRSKMALKSFATWSKCWPQHVCIKMFTFALFCGGGYAP